MHHDPSTIQLCECVSPRRVVKMWAGRNRDTDRIGWYSYCDDCRSPVEAKDAALHALNPAIVGLLSEARIAAHLAECGIPGRIEALVILRFPEGLPLGVPAVTYSQFAHGEMAVCSTDADDVLQKAREWLEHPSGAVLGKRVSDMIMLAARGPLLDWANSVVDLMRLSVAPSEAERGRQAVESVCDGMRAAHYA